MITNFYIPEKLKIGFRDRKQQYVPRLAFINYYKPAGDLRFKSNFDNWIDSQVPTEEYDNVPTEGFVIDDGASRNDYKRFADTPDYIQIYDPRGFEFQISTQNFMFILNFCEVRTGKLLTGEFVYAWLGEQGNNVQLLPVVAPEYQESLDRMKLFANSKELTESDLVVGNIYHHKRDGKLVFLGKFPEYYTEVKNGLQIRKQSRKLVPYFAKMSENELVCHILTYDTKSYLKYIAENGTASEDFMDKCIVALEYNGKYTQFPKDMFSKGYDKLVGIVFERREEYY